MKKYIVYVLYTAGMFFMYCFFGIKSIFEKKIETIKYDFDEEEVFNK